MKRDEDLIREVIERMAKGEQGLHTKLIEPYKIVRVTTIPVLLKDLVHKELRNKKFEVKKKLKRNGHTILLLRRPL